TNDVALRDDAGDLAPGPAHDHRANAMARQTFGDLAQGDGGGDGLHRPTLLLQDASDVHVRLLSSRGCRTAGPSPPIRPLPSGAAGPTSWPGHRATRPGLGFDLPARGRILALSSAQRPTARRSPRSAARALGE